MPKDWICSQCGAWHSDHENQKTMPILPKPEPSKEFLDAVADAKRRVSSVTRVKL